MSIRNPSSSNEYDKMKWSNPGKECDEFWKKHYILEP
jgi:hypothetical protein